MREMNPQSEDKNNFAFGHIEVKLQSATYPGKFLEVIKEKKIHKMILSLITFSNPKLV